MGSGQPRLLAALAPLAMLASCSNIIPPAAPPPAPVRPVAATVAPALLAGVSAGPAIASLKFERADATGALARFTESCPRLLARPDTSGLTRQADWQPACAAAATWPRDRAADFFAASFEAVQVGNGTSFVTGYYEPELAGVRTRQPGFDIPVYGPPASLVRANPGDAAPLPDGRMPLGRYAADGSFVPFYTRGEIDDGALEATEQPIAWAADYLELFFLQVQGSGRLRAPDGTVMRIGYAATNGYPFTGPGSILRSLGKLGNGPGQYPGSMQGIKRYIRENPTAGRELLRANQSYIFFRELTAADHGDMGPLGSLGVPVIRGDSAAADPAYVPLGAPVFLSLDRAEASGLWIAQDTGGAIKGANRFDSFWGAGEDAARIAGGMTARGTALLLLPKGTLARLAAVNPAP